MAQIENMHGYSLFAKLHSQRSNHEGRIQPSAFMDSTIVGKSVNRCDSNRVPRLVRVAKSVTGQVRWQVTGRNPTFKISRPA